MGDCLSINCSGWSLCSQVVEPIIKNLIVKYRRSYKFVKSVNKMIEIMRVTKSLIILIDS